jgi:hypothetical protein
MSWGQMNCLYSRARGLGRLDRGEKVTTSGMHAPKLWEDFQWRNVRGVDVAGLQGKVETRVWKNGAGIGQAS